METLNFSFFSDRLDNDPKPHQATWDDLVEYLQDVRKTSCTPETCLLSKCPEKDGRAWSPAAYPPGQARAAEAVAEVCALVLDIDHVPNDATAQKYLDKIRYQHIIHGSHSDRLDDRCFRVVIALNRPVSGKDWPRFWTNVVNHLAKDDGIPITRRSKPNPHGGIDTQTKDASRIFFLPSRPTAASGQGAQDGTDYLFAHIPGPTLNVDDFLGEPDHDPFEEKAPTTPAVINSNPTRNSNPTVTSWGPAIDLLKDIWPGEGQRHEATLALCGALAHSFWDEGSIASFVQDLRDTIYDGNDPTPSKATDQARDSSRKFAAGEQVSGWTTLSKFIGEEGTNKLRKALDINALPAWVTERMSAKASTPQAPTADILAAALRVTRNKLTAKRTNVDAQLDARMLTRVLDREQLQEAGEDRQEALDHAITVLLKYSPTGTTADQALQLLAHVFPIDVGQGDLPWADTLLRLINAKAEIIAEETSENFEIALTGPNAGKPVVNTRNLDIAMKKLKRQLCFDEFAGCEKIRHGDFDWETIEDHHVASLRIRMEETFKFKPAKDEFYDYITDRARSNAIHPPREYFARVEPLWDHKPRLETWLVTYCGAEDTPLNRAIARMVLVAAVRRTRQPGCKFDEMLILEGEQGVQKSTGLRALCPEEHWFTDDLPLDADTKRQMESTNGKLIVEAGELKGMTKGDVNKLKGYLSRTEDKARMAYGRKETISPRQFIIIGTTNDAQYLRDPTGNRRFWPVRIVFVDVDALRSERDQLWAEAAYYEALGESVRLHPSLYGMAAEEQEERRVVDTIEMVLEDALAGKVGRIKSTDIWTLLGKDPIDAKPEEQIRMGDAMRRLGWESSRPRVKGQRTRFYMKGDEHEREVVLGVTGRKVVRMATGPGLPTDAQTVKVN